MSDTTPTGRPLSYGDAGEPEPIADVRHCDRRYREHPDGNRSGTYPYGAPEPYCLAPHNGIAWTSSPDLTTCDACKQAMVFEDFCHEQIATEASR